MLDNLKSAIVADMENYRRADFDRIEAAIACGQKLKLAKDDIAHGHWLPFIESINLPGRTATRWMQIADWDTDSVRKAGGIAAAAEFESDYPTDEAKKRYTWDRLKELWEELERLGTLYPIVLPLNRALADEMEAVFWELARGCAEVMACYTGFDELDKLNEDMKSLIPNDK